MSYCTNMRYQQFQCRWIFSPASECVKHLLLFSPRITPTMLPIFDKLLITQDIFTIRTHFDNLLLEKSRKKHCKGWIYLHLIAFNSGKYVRRMFCKLYSIYVRMHCHVDKCHHKYIRIYEPYVTRIQMHRKRNWDVNTYLIWKFHRYPHLILCSYQNKI